jgi:hypothetical protein
MDYQDIAKCLPMQENTEKDEENSGPELDSGKSY